MPVTDIGLARTIRLIAATIAIIVAVSLPLGYWLVVYSFAAEATAFRKFKSDFPVSSGFICISSQICRACSVPW